MRQGAECSISNIHTGWMFNQAGCSMSNIQNISTSSFQSRLDIRCRTFRPVWMFYQTFRLVLMFDMSSFQSRLNVGCREFRTFYRPFRPVWMFEHSDRYECRTFRPFLWKWACELIKCPCPRLLQSWAQDKLPHLVSGRDVIGFCLYQY